LLSSDTDAAGVAVPPVQRALVGCGGFVPTAVS